MRLLALAASGLEKTAQQAVILQALVGASALDDFSHVDERTEAALGVIVGGRNLPAAKTGQKQLLLRA